MEIFLWSISPGGNATWLARSDILLSPAEDARARSYHFDRDREQFVAARRFLRYVLGQHLRRAPQLVDLCEAPGLKPTVEPASKRNGLHFSLSRCKDDVLIGVTRHREIGVDIESIRSLSDIDGLARSVFAPADLRTWNDSPADERLSLFFEAWTRKEALGKAMGIGIGGSPNSIHVSLAPIPEDRWSPAAPADTASKWLMSHIDVGAGERACVVIERLHTDDDDCRFQDLRIASGSTTSFNDHSLAIPDGAQLSIRRSALSDRVY